MFQRVSMLSLIPCVPTAFLTSFSHRLSSLRKTWTYMAVLHVCMPVSSVLNVNCMLWVLPTIQIMLSLDKLINSCTFIHGCGRSWRLFEGHWLFSFLFLMFFLVVATSAHKVLETQWLLQKEKNSLTLPFNICLQMWSIPSFVFYTTESSDIIR